jgi:Anaphase-promoting complex subunit 11 RING-H2 finger
MVLVLIVPIVDFCAMAAAVSIVLVLFALAPLGSLYVFLISLQSTTTSTSILPTETTALIMDLLKKNHLLMTAEGSNTTSTSLDELWTSVIASISEDPAFSELLRQRTIHHLRLVVPWIVTFIILAITAIPCIVVGTARHRRYHRNKNPHRIRKVVTAALDCLVAKSTMKTTTTTTTEGHGICGICLEGLPDGNQKTEDDVVVVLGVCCHAFHEHCISHWLCRRRSHYQCPMCRQDFFDVSTTRKLKRMSGSYVA